MNVLYKHCVRACCHFCDKCCECELCYQKELVPGLTSAVNYLNLPLDQGFSKSDTVGTPSDKAWKKVPPQPPLVYLLSFTEFLDTYGMLFDLIDTQQLCQDSLILLFDKTSDYTKYIKNVCPNTFISFWLCESQRSSKIPQNTVSLNYLFNQITHI